MKGLSVTGFIIAALLFLGAMYLQFVIAPSVASLEAAIDYNDESNLSRIMWMQALELKSGLGIVMLLGGILPLILCIIPALKVKNKLAWLGVILSLVVVLIGLINGTHMFS
ncbi:MAG: hypothetical protein Q8M29_10795 [Bacteroidota bacterium]|nr:hypothetical protein [Bacteroidota bacterium]